MEKSDKVRLVEDANRQMASGGCFVPMLVAIVTVLLCLGSCCTCKEMPSIEVRTDTVYQSKVQRDSIHVRDSIYIHDYAKGDTLYRDRHHWHTEYVERLRTDTLFEVRTDSIPYPVKEFVEVPRKKSWFDKTQQYGFWLFLALWGIKYRKKLLALSGKLLR